MTLYHMAKNVQWVSVKLEELAADGLQNGVYKPATAYGQGIPIIRINDFDNSGKFLGTELQRIALTEDEIDRFGVQENDILINRVNSLSHIGKSVIVKKVTEPTVYESNMMRLRLDGSSLLPDFLACLLQTSSVRNYFRKVAKKAVAQASINQEDIKALEFLLPPLPEQRKIAEILSTWDEAIDLTEQLIAAKQRRKQALMQRLLTGQVRFPGFEEEWTRDKLQNIATIDYGKSPNEIRDDNGSFNIWGTGGIVGKTNIALCSSPAVIIGRKGTIDKPILTESPFWTIDTTFYCLPKSGNHVGWLYYALSQTDLKQYNEASGVPSLSRNTLYHIEMQVPSIAEQDKIAEVLSACDDELTLHQQKLAALRHQKGGLMQQLLTGRVRVTG